MTDSLEKSLSGIGSIESFRDWARGELRFALPHGALISGLGHLHAGGVGLDYLVTVDFPVTHIEAIRNRAGAIETPILRTWLETRQPVYFSLNNPWPDVPRNWLQSFRQHRLRNVLADAYYDNERCMGTYYSLFQIPEDPGNEYITRFSKLVPALHETMCRIFREVRLTGQAAEAGKRLTDRERKVADAMRLGKTNAEIAVQLGLSENTIKHHATAIYAKYGVSNRAQLVRELTQTETGQTIPGSATRIIEAI